MLLWQPKSKNAGSNNHGMTYPVRCKRCNRTIKVVKGKTASVAVCRKCQRS